MRIVLKQERKEYVLEQPIPEEPATNATRTIKDAFQKYYNDSIDVTCTMLCCMEADLQKQLMDLNLDAYAMINHLKEMFQENARIERYNTIRDLFSCKMSAGTAVSPHILKMKGYLEYLARLGLGIMNYNMHNMDKTVSELHGMLQTAEKNIKGKPKDVLMVNKGTSFEKAGAKKGDHGGGKGKAPMVHKTKAKSNSRIILELLLSYSC